MFLCNLTFAYDQREEARALVMLIQGLSCLLEASSRQETPRSSVALSCAPSRSPASRLSHARSR
jgi:hypothetical protein